MMMSPAPRSIIGGRKRAAHQVRPAHVDGEHVVPLVGLDVDQGRHRTGDAGVVDEDRDLLVGDGVAQRGHRRRDRRRRRARRGRRGRRRRARADVSSSVLAVRPATTTRTPRSARAVAIARPEAVAAAGDERRASGEAVRHCSPTGRAGGRSTRARPGRTSPRGRRPSGRGPRTARRARARPQSSPSAALDASSVTSW